MKHIIIFLSFALLFLWGEMAIDTGACVLILDDTLACSIGYFQYPRYTPNSLFMSSMLLGNSERYVVDCFLQTQPVSDWRWIEHWREIIPPLWLSEQTFCSLIDDGNHPTPKGIRARRFFIGRGSRNYPAFDDFVILIYNYINPTDSAILNCYAGLFLDLDLGASPTVNWGRTNQSKRFTYMWPSLTSQFPTIGVRLLYPKTPANLSLIDHAQYVYPEMPESTKYKFLNGTIRLPNSTRAYDYSICVSFGPFNLLPQDSSIWGVFALIGGLDSISAGINSDSAQSWWNCVTKVGEIDKQSRSPKLKIWPDPARNILYCQIEYPEERSLKE